MSCARWRSTALRPSGSSEQLRAPVHRAPSVNRDGISGRALIDRQTIHVPDLLAAVETEFPAARSAAYIGGSRAQVAVPLLRGEEAIGVLSVLRFEPGPFAEDQIRLLETFADQAVIAIENARLFSELEQRNDQLTETLDQQTATAEVLRAIASSPTALGQVLDTIVATAARLCGATGVGIWIVDGDEMLPPARFGTFGHSGESASPAAQTRASSSPETPRPAVRSSRRRIVQSFGSS